MSKKVLVAGASRGLGFCLAQRYLEAGYSVFAGARDVECAGIAALKEKFAENVIPVEMDVTKTPTLVAAAATVAEYTDYLDVVINSAAIHGATSFLKLPDTDLDDCVDVFDVNSVGPLRVVKVFLPFLSGEKFSSVINISSESGSIGICEREKEFAYCMSKAALNMGTKLLQNYLKGRNIKVLAVQPGWMRTDMGGPNAHLDPYETACKLFDLFEELKITDGSMFVDNDGKELPW